MFCRIYTPFHPEVGDSAGKTVKDTVLNALIVLAVVVVMTTILVLLYKYKFYKVCVCYVCACVRAFVCASADSVYISAL